MLGTASPASASPRPLGVSALVGRCFMHPAVDYLFVGGGITFPVLIGLYFLGAAATFTPSIYLFLLINGAHFAASTVRLYTKPGATREFPILSWLFPAVCLLAVGVGLTWPLVGTNLTSLYLTWSPYHYAAQTYGLAVMYAMRSGARLDQRDKHHIWLVCLLPFLYALLTSTNGGLSWFVTRATIESVAGLSMAYDGVVRVLSIAVCLLPFSLFWQLHRWRGRNVPLIVLLLQVSNGIWWLIADYPSAFWWATAFHSIQYLIIVVATHVDEQMATDNVALGRWHRPWFHGAWFYGLSFVVAGFIFFALPMVAYVPFGFAASESILMMVVIINLHHFIVDSFIWKRRPARPALAHSVETPGAA